MKKFKQLYYSGLAILGIPFMIIVMAIFFGIASNLKNVTKPIEEKIEKPKVDTVVVEKKVVVHDTVYIKPKPTPKPVVTIQDTL